jgi:very-short-patch-repair endonuclease
LLLIDAGYPEPLINDATVVDGGTQILHPDLKWPQWRIVLEYEGDGHRTSAKQFRADIRRKDKFEAAGWHVVRVTADDLFVDRAAFLERIARTVALRQSYRA